MTTHRQLPVIGLLLMLSLVSIVGQGGGGGDRPPDRAQAPKVEPAPTTPSELQRLKVENLQLKIQLAQLQATLADREAKLASVSLTTERTALEAELLKTLHAEPGDTIDWATLTLKKPDPPPVKK